jgi:hypothetical protein
MNEPIAWGLPRNGQILDCITPDEHARRPGGYTVALYAHPPSGPDPETLATQIAFSMRLADAPLSEAQFVTLCAYLKARSEP